jgi:hypothetical protein
MGLAVAGQEGIIPEELMGAAMRGEGIMEEAIITMEAEATTTMAEAITTTGVAITITPTMMTCMTMAINIS